MRAYTTALADDRMEGRETGTRGFDRAASYVIKELRRLGISPAARDYRQRFDMWRGRVDESSTLLEIADVDGTRRFEYSKVV